jgi:hypothetical protein
MSHPAPFNPALLPVIAAMLPRDTRRVLDPFCGTGRIVRLSAWLPEAEFYGYEIEHEWATEACAAGCCCTCGDSRQMHYPAHAFGAAATSATYATRMADKFRDRQRKRIIDPVTLEERYVAKYKRTTYTHCLGRQLTPGNSGAMQWGEDYRQLHREVYRELRRVLQPGGAFILNMKDHIRKGRLIPVTNWHAVTLLQMGFVLTARERVPCPGNRYGANRELRVPYESILRFELRI